MSKYKPGQLITINGHVYRVTKQNGKGWCRDCAFNGVKSDCVRIFTGCISKIGYTNHLELVK